MNRPLTIGSLFSGIGGLELGLERAGLGPVVWQVEKDEYCRAVLAKHWPDATRYEDVKDVGRANLVPVDVICGGFPCQDISVAGKGAGLDGARSGLWSEFARIVREVRPRYVIVENAAALLARGLGRVLGDLATSGYGAEWDCVPAASVGAPHERDRLFIVAYAEHGRLSVGRRAADTHATSLDAGGVRRDDGSGGEVEAGPVVGVPSADADGDGERCEESHVATIAVHSRFNPRHALASGCPWEAEPRLVRVAHGVSDRPQRIRAVGNAVVPQVAEVVGRVVLALEAERLASEAA
jgi:DNA (cytosine-5)-methyltransferase 1